MRLVPILGLIALGSSLFAGGPTTEQMLAISKVAAAVSEGASITTRIGGETVRVTRKDGAVHFTMQGTAYRVPVAGTPAPAKTPSQVMVPVVQGIAQANQQATPPVQIFVQGFADAVNSARAGFQYNGTWVYGGLAFTGLNYNTLGVALPGPLGDFFANVGNGLDNAAWNVAKAIKIGPYSIAN
ncbi:MAG: hypothetical protein J0M02_03325 [Planctomycetes bacterium]|nr:hypothetical protein [Planctomycetota bacterium]